MTNYTITRFEIPNDANVSAGDTFSLNIPVGSRFMCLEIENDTPYLTYRHSIGASTRAENFMYAEPDMVCPRLNPTYIGMYDISTSLPLDTRFYIFQVYD